MMARRNPKIKLTRTSKNCERVSIRGMYADNPIGTVCKINGGYEYTNPPTPTTKRGPVKTKSRAILAVVKGWRTWVGI